MKELAGITTSITSVEVPFCGDNSIISRSEAKSKLQQLKPGTKEYSELQHSLTRTSGISEVKLAEGTIKVDSSSYAGVGGFGSSEHVHIGSKTVLKGLPENASLLMKGTVGIKFRHIVALAGDFYGVAGEAISLPGGNDDEKTARFENAFATLANADNEQIRLLLQKINEECESVSHAALPHHCYSIQVMEKNRAIKKIKGDVDELLIDNSDHFFINAEDAYRIGHTLAIRVATEAGRQQNLEELKRAYAIDAFACHFLTDLFAAGHIRNQRGQLEIFLITQLNFSSNNAKQLAGLLTGAQHEKDGNEGLNVTNRNGEQWRAYGDGCYFSPQNSENKTKAIVATQQSVDEIYNAYASPDVPPPNLVYQLIPHAVELNRLPLYSVIEDNTRLILHLGDKDIEIRSKLDCLRHLVSQALRYLPQTYIDGFLQGYNPLSDIEIPPLLDAVVIPQIERLTGSIWHMIGLASYYQVNRESRQLNEKLDEMAAGVRATYDKTVEIQEKLERIDARLSQHIWATTFREVLDPIASIQDVAHQHNLYTGFLETGQLEESKRKLWDAYIRISRVFTNSSVRVLTAYQTMIKEQNSDYSDLEINIANTLWFRQMLDYQIRAFNLYIAVRIFIGDNQENQIRELVLIFESNLEKQIENCGAHINTILVYEIENYISLQLKKNTIKRLASANLIQNQ